MANTDDNPFLLGYERTYNALADDKSKKVLIDRTKFCLNTVPMECDTLNTVYFDSEIIKLSSSEVFIDCGMFTGDTAEVFFKKTNSKYAHYYGFEPDPENIGKAYKNLFGKNNITIEAKGIYSIKGTLSFSDGNLSGSAICDDGGISIEVISLDEYFADKPHAPTFIKMDIEGAELEALKGAERIIREHKPKLAICAYHKPEDIYTLPEIIKSYRADYVFYLRHYTDVISETVLYAV